MQRGALQEISKENRGIDGKSLKIPTYYNVDNPET